MCDNEDIMHIRPLSDVHLEFGYLNVSTLPTDPDTVLVLAGDIGLVHKPSVLKQRFIPFLTECNAAFRATILILGNHEHYGGSIHRTADKMRSYIQSANLEKVFLLEKEVHVIDDVAFIGTTLWTDCDNHSPYAGMLWHTMSDNKAIRSGPPSDPYKRRFTAMDSWVEHRHSKLFLFNAVRECADRGLKTVVVTHHAPTRASLSPHFEGDSLNLFYASEMTLDIMDCPPDLMIHGHVHHASDYLIDSTQQICNTRVVCNPRGYCSYDSHTGFNPILVVDL